MIEENKSYCALLWNHLCVRPNNKVLPCCRFNPDHFPQIELMSDPVESLNIEEFRRIREKALRGDLIEGCEKCYQQERAGIMSFREFVNSQDQSENKSPTIGSEEIKSLEVFLGNVCNLRCVTCFAELSSAWRSEYERIGRDLPIEIKTQDVDLIIKKLVGLTKVKFVGGEPLLSKHHVPALRELCQNGPEEVELEYFTNGTVYPGPEVIELWKKFSKVLIWFSIDGTDRAFEFIRFPGKWNVVDQHFKKLLAHSQENSNLELRVMVSVSVFNIWTLNRIEEWFEKAANEFKGAGLEHIHFNPIERPSYMALANLPNKGREQILKGKILSSKRLIPIANFIENFRSEYSPFDNRLIKFIRRIERSRGLLLEDSIPELAECLAEKMILVEEVI